MFLFLGLNTNNLFAGNKKTRQDTCRVFLGWIHFLSFKILSISWFGSRI